MFQLKILLPWDISHKCIYGQLKQRTKLAFPANIENKFCYTSFKTLQSKRALLLPVWPSSYFWPLIYPNGKQMADFIIIESFYYSEAADSVFNGNTKFKTIILNIDCSNK